MLAGLITSRLLVFGTVLANRATAPATTGLATEVPDSPLKQTAPVKGNIDSTSVHVHAEVCAFLCYTEDAMAVCTQYVEYHPPPPHDNVTSKVLKKNGLRHSPS